VKIISEEGSSEVIVNALKAITCLSEAPEGREWLGQHVPQVIISILSNSQSHLPALS